MAGSVWSNNRQTVGRIGSIDRSAELVGAKRISICRWRERDRSWKGRKEGALDLRLRRPNPRLKGSTSQLDTDRQLGKNGLAIKMRRNRLSPLQH